MSDLISRSELLEEFDWLKMTVGSGSVGDIEDAIERIRKTPAVDAIEVVRCKYCENYRSSPFGHPTIGWCKVDGKHRGQNFYCANGEEKK